MFGTEVLRLCIFRRRPADVRHPRFCVRGRHVPETYTGRVVHNAGNRVAMSRDSASAGCETVLEANRVAMSRDSASACREKCAGGMPSRDESRQRLSRERDRAGGEEIGSLA